jgi:hypothetical protein
MKKKFFHTRNVFTVKGGNDISSKKGFCNSLLNIVGVFLKNLQDKIFIYIFYSFTRENKY